MNPRGFYHFGSFRLDPVARVLTRDGKPVPITGKAFETLLVLVRNQGRVVPKDELMAAVWPDTVVEESSLAQSVSTIRKVLGEKVGEHRYIVTASGRGYSFVAGVRQTASFERLPPLREWAILPTLVIAFAGVWLLSGHSGSNSAGWPPKIVPFTDYPGVEEFPAFSPDGKQIAFVWGGENQENEDIYVKRIGAGTPLRLTTNPAADVFPAWSPDGRSIAFVRAGSDGGGILTVPASGGAERRILKLSAGGYVCNGIAWLPDGKSLAVPIKSRAEDPTAIMAVPVDGGKARRLTSPPRNTIGDSSPSYSPDGKTLAFLRSATVSEADIYMMPASGGQVRQVSFDHTWFSGFSWTADGSAIIASSGRVGINGLWRYPVERGWFSRATPTVVLPGEGQEFPTVSPTGGYLAYAQGSANLNIWRLDLASLSQSANPAKCLQKHILSDIGRIA